MDKYHQKFQEYQAYLKQQIACRFPYYLSQHVENVANLALKNMQTRDGFLSDEYHIWTIGLLHDILEDTDCVEDDLQTIVEDAFEKYHAGGVYTNEVISCVLTLTHDKEEKTYEQYIMDIVKSYKEDDTYCGIYCFLVKKADFADHFQRWQTLTPQLIEKYKPFIQYFLQE
ncbi:MAG: hypothetical protein IJV35_11305 [Neisseriaceae bacterium]|nr:hypothetical protein [Neisseriaceae bacterium]MBQ9683839.1 hypothetical protein [Neisseriaceae bacterium]MBQ9724746.1 hypothetical protein [Neisseriaceae bacterium]MBR1819961.1 hypothetical protein [Neisseriaceae bacterium]